MLLQTADETLDYRYAEKYYEGTNIVIDEGGSHSFDNLESKTASILIHLVKSINSCHFAEKAKFKLHFLFLPYSMVKKGPLIR